MEIKSVYRLVFEILSVKNYDFMTSSLNSDVVTPGSSVSFAALRKLRQIRRSVPTAIFLSLVVTVVLTRLDYRNAALVALTTYLVQRLQSVLNAAARVTNLSPAICRSHH